MAWCRPGDKPLSEPMLVYCPLTLSNKLQWNLNRKAHIFIQENTFEYVVWKIATILSRSQCVHPLWPSNTIWRYRSESRLANYLTVSSHYLSQRRLVINGVLWHSPTAIFTKSAQDLNSWNEFENTRVKFLPHSPGAIELIQNLKMPSVQGNY